MSDRLTTLEAARKLQAAIANLHNTHKDRVKNKDRIVTADDLEEHLRIDSELARLADQLGIPRPEPAPRPVEGRVYHGWTRIPYDPTLRHGQIPFLTDHWL